MGSMERQRQSAEATTAVRSEPFPAGTNIARYRILSLIGSGAMGDVYRVREEKGAMNLWLRPLSGGDAKKLTSFSEGTIAAYAWRDDGSRAAVTHVVDSTDVVLIK
jgi:hypothetical protein